MLDATLHSIETGKLDDADEGARDGARAAARDDPRAARPLVRARAGRAPRPGLRRRRCRRSPSRSERAEPPPDRPRRRGGGATRRDGAGRALHDHPRAARPGGPARAADADRRDDDRAPPTAASRRASPTTPSPSAAAARSRRSRSASSSCTGRSSCSVDEHRTHRRGDAARVRDAALDDLEVLPVARRAPSSVPALRRRSPARLPLPRGQHGDPPQRRRRVRGDGDRSARHQQGRAALAACRATPQLAVRRTRVGKIAARRFGDARPCARSARLPPRPRRRRGRARAPARARSRSRRSRRRRRRRPRPRGRRSALPSSRSTRARSSTRRPPIVCVIDAITRTAATAPSGGVERQLLERDARLGRRGLDDLGHGPVAHAAARAPPRRARSTRARPAAAPSPGRRSSPTRRRRGGRRTRRRPRRRCARSGA